MCLKQIHGPANPQDSSKDGGWVIVCDVLELGLKVGQRGPQPLNAHASPIS